jgi:uncharacterized protein YbaP (TraB family)
VGRIKGRWFLAIGLLCSLTARAASPVWIIQGDHNTVYLAGSVHLLKAGDSNLPGGFDRAYSGSKELVMELAIDKLDPMEAAGWMMEHGMLKEGTTLRSTIGEERYRRVSAAAAGLGVPMEAIDQLEPWVVALQLTEMQYMQMGFDPQQGVEQQLEHRAQSDGKSIRGLETVEEQLGVLQGMSYADQSRFLDMTVAEMPDAQGETAVVMKAWRAGDADRLAALLSDEYKSFPALYRVLVTERNKRWVPQIEKLLHDKQDYFVVVGALHLVGDNGLLELIRRDGFKPQQLN